MTDKEAERPPPPPVTTDSVLQAMADALPTHPANDESSDIASSYEVVALLAHAYFASLDFRLCGFNEDKLLPECQSLAPRLPPQWNDGFGALSFVYKHQQSAMTFVLRVDRMGSKVEVRALAVGAENIHRVEYATRDVVRASNLPLRITLDGQGNEDRSDLVGMLKNLFVSFEIIETILRDLRVKLVQKLVPKLQRNGYVETEELEASEGPRAQTRTQQVRRGAQQTPHGLPAPARPVANLPPFHPLAPPQPLAGLGYGNAPQRPLPGDFAPPGFEDEHQINAPPRPMVGMRIPPVNIGHDDLNPRGLGPHDPLRGSFVGGGQPRPGGFAGMHPTFSDPLFTGEGGWGGQPEGQIYNPQRPPGARYDPVNPGDGPPAPYPQGQMPPFPGRRNGGGFGGGGGFGYGPGDII
ncbi:PI31 proteasome regulator N-terminal domain-containing protein [Trichoderma barbatum]